MIKEREGTIEVMKKIDLDRYPKDKKNAPSRIRRQVKKSVPASIGLRDCLKSINEKFPWSRSKLKLMVTISFFLQVFMGVGFYALDIYSDIKFTLDMYYQSERNFGESFISCFEEFSGEFDQTIHTCKLAFDKKACMEDLALVKKSADRCFQDGDRFGNPNQWRFAGVVCTIHIVLPFLAAFLAWAVLLIQDKCSGSLISILAKLPLPFVTKSFKFWYDWEMYENYADPGKHA